MTSLLAAEGGYQSFTLGTAEWMWLCVAAGVAILALILGYILMRGVLAQDAGTQEMQDIAGAIQEGASAYLKRQFRTIGMIVVPLAVVVFVTSTAIRKEIDNPLTGLSAFKAFQAGLKERCVEPPVFTELSPVDSYSAVG